MFPPRPVSCRSGVSAERRRLRAKPAPKQPTSSPSGTLAARSPVRLPVRFKTAPTPCKHWLGTLARFKTPPMPPQAQVLQAVGDDVRSRSTVLPASRTCRAAAPRQAVRQIVTACVTACNGFSSSIASSEEPFNLFQPISFQSKSTYFKPENHPPP